MKIVLTRARDQGGELPARLRALGHEVELCPLIEIQATGPETVDVGGYDWVIVTSPNGARELVRRMRGRPSRIAAIGPGTAAVLRAEGLEPDLIPSKSTQEGLLAEFPRPPGRVLFAAAEGARQLLARELGADTVALYRTLELRPSTFPDGDLVVLMSPSAARAYGRLGGSLPAVTIGPETKRAAANAGIQVVAKADEHDLDGLVKVIEWVAAGLRSGRA